MWGDVASWTVIVLEKVLLQCSSVPREIWIHAFVSLRGSTALGEVARSHARAARERRRECEVRGKKWELATISHEFSFHLGNRRKPQSVKTVTGNKKCVSRLSVTCIGHEPVTLAFQEQNITITITKTRLPKEENWSGHSDLYRSL